MNFLANLGECFLLLPQNLRWDLNPIPLSWKASILPLNPWDSNYSRYKLKLTYIASAIMDTELQIVATIIDTIEKSCFLALIFQMQPMNQISYHKYWDV